MRQLIDMNNKSEVGYVDWEFIHDMEGLAPDKITPEMIFLSQGLLKKIPEKWHDIKDKLTKHMTNKGGTLHIAIADVENLGDEFKVRATLKNQNDEPLAFHRVILYDKDRFEDDYLGAVITDQDGELTLAFGKKVFSDFGMESEPDVYFKVFRWENNQFVKIGQVMPKVLKKTEMEDRKIVMEFGVVTIPVA